jgi:putative restriction endonuclease
MSCFLALEVLAATYGGDLPYRGGLDAGFAFQGRRVPFLNLQKGIHRAAAQTGPAALSIQTSYRSPYDDAITEAGFSYAYRAGDIDQADNRAIRAALELEVPLVYFVGTRPGWYRPIYPVFVTVDDPANARVIVAPGVMSGSMDEPEPAPIVDIGERRYAVRETRVRLHQARFRGAVLPAYRDRCAICRLKEIRLLDAAHITADLDEGGDAVVSNGLSLCTIHHRAFDHDLVGITADYEVRVSRRLLDDEDGPMLEVLKQFHGSALVLPSNTKLRPDRERLALRFERFAAA